MITQQRRGTGERLPIDPGLWEHNLRRQQRKQAEREASAAAAAAPPAGRPAGNADAVSGMLAFGGAVNAAVTGQYRTAGAALAAALKAEAVQKAANTPGLTSGVGMAAARLVADPPRSL